MQHLLLTILGNRTKEGPHVSSVLPRKGAKHMDNLRNKLKPLIFYRTDWSPLLLKGETFMLSLNVL